MHLRRKLNMVNVNFKRNQNQHNTFQPFSVSHLRQAFVKVAKVNAVFKHWKEFAKGLGVPDTEINKIEEKGGSGQVIYAL